MPDDVVRVRKARPDDVPDIVELSDALFREDAGSRDPFTNADWALQEGQEYFADLLTEDSAGCWLAESAAGGAVIGYLAGRFSKGDSLRPVRVATLESMYVREEWRNLGAGASLVRHFVSWSVGQGAERASVTAYFANRRAIRFYEREGFSPKSLSLENGVG